MMQHVGRRYVPHVNHAHRRTGTLWEGRFKASVIDGPRHLLTCHRYIELNPVRAGMVASPERHRWSSHRRNALGEADPTVRPHPLYLDLGRSDAEREAAYRELFSVGLDPDQADEVRASLQTGTPLGAERFRAEIERALKVKAGHSRRGRPRKHDKEAVRN